MHARFNFDVPRYIQKSRLSSIFQAFIYQRGGILTSVGKFPEMLRQFP